MKKLSIRIANQVFLEIEDTGRIAFQCKMNSQTRNALVKQEKQKDGTECLLDINSDNESLWTAKIIIDEMFSFGQIKLTATTFELYTGEETLDWGGCEVSKTVSLVGDLLPSKYR